MKRILVTGGTGSLGRIFMKKAKERGYCVRIMSRAERSGRFSGVEWARADLETGEGLSEAVADVFAVLHAATARAFGDYKKVDVRGTRRLLRLLASSQVRHLLFPSIVGVDKIPQGYYRAKLQIEEEILELARIPVMLVPARFQNRATGKIDWRNWLRT